VEAEADKAVAFEPLVGVAAGNWQIAGGHTDGQGAPACAAVALRPMPKPAASAAPRCVRYFDI
jgi:hypothetical protein